MAKTTRWQTAVAVGLGTVVAGAWLWATWYVSPAMIAEIRGTGRAWTDTDLYALLVNSAAVMSVVFCVVVGIHTAFRTSQAVSRWFSRRGQGPHIRAVR
ncbi:Uncharacterised protein [Mycobacteroides abscessus subsp. abscessus]|nr:Uncharacterised protein [Mycobacteroides abscessus subsp. abscessus]SIJ01303.1 Uncharacterised protein [Mycobacteroides abscessus subsp. abscessus]SIK58481.1 Uncharacterised protein [Mycobacteroides abscessus subsp. abscessus]SIL83292.1 Uncharacterised protein [Mycobacteroides abscessus subsp. abscessus]SIM13838.1 Uncharacterised protein [Mycobacteroides abscessus subsp. abscessus]